MSALPPLYDRWITQLAGDEIPGEPNATCLDCAMVVPSAGAGFDPNTKCCTHLPNIPNFLVGAALSDERLDELGGRESLRARIARRIGVSPLGLASDRVTSLLGERSTQAFGRVANFRCPHYHGDTGACRIWLHRESVCSTWFCKYERGAVGQAFWWSVRNLLGQVEYELSRWCVLELGAPYDAARARPGELTADELNGVVADDDHERVWGVWAGRELELYSRCHALAGDLTWSDVAGRCGPEVGLLARALTGAYDRRKQHVVPASLLLRKLHIERPGEPTVLGTYTGTDPIAVPEVLVPLLPVFRGQPTGEARAEIEREAGVALDDELLVRLVDFGILVDPTRRL